MKSCGFPRSSGLAGGSHICAVLAMCVFTLPSLPWPCDLWASLCHPLPRVLSGAGTAKGCSVVTSHSTEFQQSSPNMKSQLSSVSRKEGDWVPGVLKISNVKLCRG